MFPSNQLLVIAAGWPVVAQALARLVLSGHRGTDWLRDCHMTGDWAWCVLGPVFLNIGEALATTILVSFYMVSLYWWTESIYPPAVVLTLFPATLIANVEGPVAVFLGLLVTVALGLAYYAIFDRG